MGDRSSAEMKTVSIITEVPVVDRILPYFANKRCKADDPFEPRALPRFPLQSVIAKPILFISGA
jgi:hypothetical protein